MTSATLFCDNCGAANQSQSVYCRSCGSSLQATKPTIFNSQTGRLLTNILLKQRYRIVAPIGKGGMGVVYQAEDTLLGDRKVAVKEMRQSGLSPQEQKEAADAFRQEAILLAHLQHRNLPSIFDHFEENGRWYLVMSFIEGETLADYLNHTPSRKLPLNEAVQIGIQLCTVLDYLHTQQPPIIFRDLKPSNIMRTADGHIYLIDFGIARHFKPGQAKDTAYYGSMGYAPPEQYGKAQTTPRTDIYSLGVVLYQMFSGHNPSSTPFQFPPLQSHVPTVPTELATLITRMLEIDADKRPASMTVVKQKLQSIAMVQSNQAHAPIRIPIANKPITPTTTVASASAAPSIPSRGVTLQPRTIVMGILGVIIVVGGLFYFTLSHNASTSGNINLTQSNIAAGNQTQTAIPTAPPTPTPTMLPTPTPTPLISTLPAVWQGILNGCGGISTCKVQLKITTKNPDNTFAGEWSGNYDDGAGYSNIEWITGAIDQHQITWQGTGHAVGNIVSNCSYSGVFNSDGSISGQVLYGCGGTFTIYKK